jgi:hypothetical protein
VVFGEGTDGGAVSERGGEDANGLRERSTGAVTEKGLTNEDVPSGEPTVRSSTSGRAKFVLRGERRGQREDSCFTRLTFSTSVKGFQGQDPRTVAVAERFAEKNRID